MFIDHAKIYVKAGDGGAGALSFHTEKYITNGGPDGGDGGDGGNVVFVAARNLTSLQNFRFKHKFVAENGVKGGNRKMYGRCGEDLEIGVPVGTVIRNADTGELIADFTEDGQTTNRLIISNSVLKSCEITVAIPAPFAPMGAIPSLPKIRI